MNDKTRKGRGRWWGEEGIGLCRIKGYPAKRIKIQEF